MQKHEISQHRTYAGEAEWLDGRWIVTTETGHGQKYPEFDDPGRDQEELRSYTVVNIYLYDIYGLEPSRHFRHEVRGDSPYQFLAFNEHFGVIHRQKDTFLNMELLPAELKWKPKEVNENDSGWIKEECKVGTDFWFPDEPDRRDPWSILVDKANPSTGNLNFLIYTSDNSVHFYCSLNIEELIITIETTLYDLPVHLFNCLCLKNGVLSGLSTYLDTFSRYDVKKKEFLSKISIQGLPQTIRSVQTEKEIEGDLKGRLRESGAWSQDNKRLIVWSEERVDLLEDATERQINESIRSRLYCINLITGIASSLNYTFNQPIGRLFTGKDGKLYVRNDEFVGRGSYREHNDTFIVNEHTESMTTWRYRHFRIPSKQVFKMLLKLTMLLANRILCSF
ncbi:hypothetical protein M3Y97_01037700 [Aphelenchoides bicaudatus]|nr:hypothetical protein M3Y97_01037700 [Aphelenchoides bicaudatus]